MTDHGFELRLAAALRTEAERAVRPFDAVVIAVAAVRAPRPRRFPAPLTRALAYAVVAAALIAGAAIVAGTRPDVDPAPTPLAPAPVSLGADGRLLGASTWAADADLTQELGIAGRIHLVVGYGGAGASIRGSDWAVHVASRVEAAPESGVIQFTLIRDVAGCAAGDRGTYRAARSEDGLRIKLDVVADACAARSAAFARTWHRTLMLASSGGTGLIDGVEPAIRVTVPSGVWNTGTFAEGANAGTAGEGLLVMRNPQGVTDPCVYGGGTAIDIDPGSAAFAAYIDDLPGVAVTTRPTTVGGYPGLRIIASWTRDQTCPATVGRVAWRTSTDDVRHVVAGGLTGRDEVVVIDGPGGTFLFTMPADPSILDTIEFVSELSGGTEPP